MSGLQSIVGSNASGVSYRAGIVSENVEPIPGSLLDGQTATEQFGQPPREWQAESGPFHLPLEPMLQLCEFFEDPPLILQTRCQCRCP